MQNLHFLLKENHPFEAGFCAGKSMEFARIVSHPDHNEMSVAEMMKKYVNKFHRVDVVDSGDYISPAAARVAHYQSLHSFFNQDNKLEFFNKQITVKNKLVNDSNKNTQPISENTHTRVNVDDQISRLNNVAHNIGKNNPK